jgi:hypothetical protein
MECGKDDYKSFTLSQWKDGAVTKIGETGSRSFGSKRNSMLDIFSLRYLFNITL